MLHAGRRRSSQRQASIQDSATAPAPSPKHPTIGKHTISFFPSTAGTETKTNPSGPSSTLEKEDGEDDTEGKAETRLDDHGGNGAVPLFGYRISPCPHACRKDIILARKCRLMKQSGQ